MKRILFSILALISYIGMANAQGERFVGTWLATDGSKSYQITFTLGKEITSYWGKTVTVTALYGSVSYLNNENKVIRRVKSNAQEKYLELTKNNTSRILKIKEDKRVVVKTKDNKRFVGKIKFIDSLHVGIDSNTIHLDSISFIKKRSIGGVVLRSASFYAGANLFIIGLVSIPTGIGAIISVATFPPSVPLLIYAVSSNKRRSEKWKYKILIK